MMPVVQRRDAESVGNQPNLAARMMPVVQRQSQPTVSIQSQPWIQRIEEQPEAKLEEDSLPVQTQLEKATIERKPEVEQKQEDESAAIQTQLENATIEHQSEANEDSEKEQRLQLMGQGVFLRKEGDRTKSKLGIPSIPKGISSN
jgi:hypothetical protein